MIHFPLLDEILMSIGDSVVEKMFIITKTKHKNRFSSIIDAYNCCLIIINDEQKTFALFANHSTYTI